MPRIFVATRTAETITSGRDADAVWNVIDSSVPRRITARPGSARGRRGGAGVTDDVDGLGRILHAQRDAQVRVRLDLLAHHTRRPLSGEQQVHAEAAAALGDSRAARR